MRWAPLLIGATLLLGCDQVTVTSGDTIASSEVEALFRKHKVDGHHAVALKKRSLAGVAYLATFHGFANNRAVCEQLIAPYNKDASLALIPGDFFCEEFR